ncbi:glycogen/starch/alpha-glucan phosphorylase [Arenimonas sp. GDDSR-1]|uniref:glycogen/starch/alpha-glucan phosphorylase n=1 Tax=Arenimonas sp. GDDSR-1 TaxID=2950125 RepID=UPI00263108AE|nr:glycogen/starch/alpha-glucan phosphorylase [Arenimonas sp. GDDSR-1]
MTDTASPLDSASRDTLKNAVVTRFNHLAAQQAGVLDTRAALRLAAEACRDELATRWAETQQADAIRGERAPCRRVHYLSMEFLMGRAMGNALAALGLEPALRERMAAHGIDLSTALESESDAALGNGGLGRLAACFLDAFAELELPSFGYGLRYRFGMFKQTAPDGVQVETADDWLRERSSIEYTVGFGGRIESTRAGGRLETDRGSGRHWVPAERVRARAFDFIVPAHHGRRVSTLRQWQALPEQAIDFQAVVRGDYATAAKPEWQADALNWVLYPDDSHAAGRELRLRQEAFLVSASLQDMLQRHLAEFGTLECLGRRNAIHLNDTHPALAPAELMRLLVDEHGMSWDDAWRITREAVSYTNHTLMPEALETWPVALMESLLPRHLEIIYDINFRFLAEVRARFPDDEELAKRVSLIDESGERHVRMASLAVVASHRVNGVAALHSQLMVETIFADYALLYPERFHNVTNGVTPRRWLQQANPGLSGLLDARIGTGWRRDLDGLSALRVQADDPVLGQSLGLIKFANKARLAERILRETGIRVDSHSLFDVQIKRIHEYKRQLLNLLHVVARYQAMLADPAGPDGNGWQARTVIIAGKAASAYHTAKQIIRLAHDIGHVINADERLQGRLKLVFLPNYGVSLAESIIPAADLSEQISTAGTEASGTGNMKFALNGALTIGTWDGATIEMAEAIGEADVFVFGHRADGIEKLRDLGYLPLWIAQQNPALHAVLDAIGRGTFSPGEPNRYKALIDDLVGRDRYFLLADFADYVAAQQRVDALYAQPARWQAAVARNIAGMGGFSADRTIREYVARVWSADSLDSGTRHA